MSIFAGGALRVWPNNGTDWQTLAPPNTIVADTWQHLAFVWNWGHVTAYLNGVKMREGNSDFAFDSAGSGRNQNFGLGARFHDAGSDQFFGRTFDGLVDDLVIWNTGLQPANIALLAGGTAPRDIDDSIPIDPPCEIIGNGSDPKACQASMVGCHCFCRVCGKGSHTVSSAFNELESTL